MKSLTVGLDQFSNEKLIINGRSFLRALVHVERKLKELQSSILPKDNQLLLLVQNWQYVVALMIRKLNAYILGETDYDIEIEHPIFKLHRMAGLSNDIDTI